MCIRDRAYTVYPAAIGDDKTSATYGPATFSLPGAWVQYSVTVTNQGTANANLRDLSLIHIFQDESHFGGLLEYPQYSRPALWHGLQAPEILLSGDHAKVARWRRKQALRRTRARRPDMFEKVTFETKQEKKLLEEIEQEGWDCGID